MKRLAAMDDYVQAINSDGKGNVWFGTINCKLNEDFSPDVLNYSATVEKSYTAFVYVTPELPLESTSGIKINGLKAKSGEQSKVGLTLGENTIDITVSGKDGDSTTYKLNIKQEDWSKVYTS